MFLARTYTHVPSHKVSLALADGIALLGPDLKSWHAWFPLEIVIDGNQTKTHQWLSCASCSGFLECDMVRDIISSQSLLTNDVALNEREPMIIATKYAYR